MIEKYKEMGFNKEQLNQIEIGLEKELNVGLYANPKFNWLQMMQIRFGLEDKLDVSLYANPEFDENQMEEIRLGLMKGLDVSQYADINCHSSKMKDIRLMMIDNSNIKNTIKNNIIERTKEKEQTINKTLFHFTKIIDYLTCKQGYKSEERIVLENIDNIAFENDRELDLMNAIVKIAVGKKDSIFTNKEVYSLDFKNKAIEKYLELLSEEEDVDIFYVIGENNTFFYEKTDCEIVKNLRKEVVE